MCNWKSGEIIKIGDSIDVRTIDGNSSHNEIRSYWKIPEDNGGLGSNLHTPVELIPTRGCKTIDQFDLVYDAEKPEWITDAMEERAKLLLFKAARRDLKLKEMKNLHIAGKAEFPYLTTVGGDLHIAADCKLPNLTTVGGALHIDANCKLPKLATVGGVLDIDADCTLPNLTTVGGYLYIRANCALPNLTTVGGVLDIRAACTLPNLTTVGGYLHIAADCALPNLTKVGGKPYTK